MADQNNKLPAEAEDGSSKPRVPSAINEQPKPTGPATDVIDSMGEAIAEDQRKGGGKRRASVKETGEELPQDEWKRFEAVNKRPR